MQQLGSKPISFYLGGSERMRLDSSGNLGLGVTPESMLSVVRAVRVGQGAMLEGRSNSTVLNLSANQYISAAGQRTYITTGEAAYYEQIVGQHRWFTAPSGTAGNAITFTQAMTLDASGNLGIGTSSPANIGAGYPHLEVNGSITGVISVSAGGVRGLALSADNSTASVQARVSGQPLVFLTNGGAGVTERFRITSAGAWGLSGANYGSAGQTLVSQGSGSPPVWGSGGVSTAKAVALALVFG
jgi:hypothetical protein